MRICGKKEKRNEKEQVLSRMKEDCLVAVVRAKNYEQGEKVVDAIIGWRHQLIELTMTMG